MTGELRKKILLAAVSTIIALGVAEAVARAIEKDTRDLYLTVRGRALSVLRGLAPPIVERAMRNIARDLADPDAPPGDEEMS